MVNIKYFVVSNYIIVVLNLKELSDNSSDESPNQYPSGVEMVVVNGKIVLEKGQRKSTFPGQHAKK